MKSVNFLVVLLTFSLFSYSIYPQTIKTPSAETLKWYSSGVFYELFVRSFKDTDGSRHGDFNGVTEKMDYLKSLGISALWLMPITDSAERTNNYDPIDYMNVDPTYGTLDDFKTLLNEAHIRDIKIIIDFVLNHTSNKHPFFIDASTNKNSKYRNWYIFQDTKPDGKWSKFWHETSTGYYYAYFVDSKPDLNFKNPEVIAYMKSVMKFWIDLGVDGFRFDAVTLLVENGDEKMKNQPETYEIYKDFRSFIDTNYPDRDIFTIAESEPPYNSYLGNGNDMFHAVFNFKFNTTVMRTVKNSAPFTQKGDSMLASLAKNYANELTGKTGGFYGTLLSNHDLYAGNRPFNQLEGNIEKTKLAGSILLTMPGIPFIYYGEELALDTYTVSKSDRWLRNCMIWDDSINSGFTTAEKPWTMINAGNDEINKKYNAKSQDSDENSILNHYRSLINIRKANPVISLGDFTSLDAKNVNVQAVLRTLGEEKILILYNFADKPQAGKIQLPEELSVKTLTELTKTGTSVKSGGKTISFSKLAACKTVILKLFH